ncbi:MAG: GNAT family protein [Flavipsychrobacter sp.]|nr:GNAT family protein [Flavipsychrobacter sp.]
MNWIQHPITLTGNKVVLVPLDSSHFPALLEIARQESIWEFMAIDGSPDKLLLELKAALLNRASGDQYPFAIIDRLKGNVIGTTRLMNIFHEHKKLEIGWTWYNPEYWGTGYNTECKLLLLTYCFETLAAVRVQLVAGEKNMRSRNAILKIGATYEGTMRKERARPDGTYRNTVMHSIIDDEWPDRKRKLEEMCKK